MMQKWIGIGLISIALLGCTSKNEKKDTRTVFKYNEMSGITSLDPAAARSFENIWVVNQLYNGLVEMSDSLIVKPSIAKSWELSSDGLVYTFHLRNDVYFHDNAVFPEGKGRRVVAEDFVLSFFRLLDPKLSGATTLLSNLDRSARSSYHGFTAPNDSTFVVYLKQPFTPFLGILTMKFFSVIPHEAVEKFGDDFRSNPVGTGPFKFKVWNEGNKLVLLKNENYFETRGFARLPYLDAVVVNFIKDKETAFFEFLKGNLDLISGLDAINREEVFTAQGELKSMYAEKFKMQKASYLKTDYLGFLVDKNLPIVKGSPFKIKEVRQAISYGFDRKKMVAYLRGGLGRVANSGIVPPGLPSYNETKVKGYDYNPEKSRELLVKAGFPGGKGLPEITLQTTEQYLDLCEFIQSQLQEVGIKIKIEVTKAAILSEAISASAINFFRKSWIGDYPDAENFLSLFYSKNFSPNGFNYTHFSNKKFDQLYEKAWNEQVDSVRYDLYQQMDQLIMDEAPVVPIYYDEVVRLVQNNVIGLTNNPMNLLNLKEVKKQN